MRPDNAIPAMRITDALDEFLLQLEANGRGADTIAQRRRQVLLLVTWLAPEDDIAAITPAVLARFLASPAARETRFGTVRKPNSANAIRGCMKCFCGFLHDAGYLPSNPARLIRKARCGQMPPRYLTADEQAQLLKVLRRDDGALGLDYAWIHLCLATGLRISSALGLAVEDVDLVRREATVRTAKNDRPLVVVLGRDIAQHIEWFIGDRRKGPLFSLTDRHARRRLTYWCERAGIRTAATPHSLRHSFGMAVYAKTGDILLTQAALGHASLMSTTVYARADRQRLREVLGA